ncbi:exodeoxyribonuclease VII large subunit [Comamonas faecalis]|uniref:Exodeoxyribonuclease 7 large subunit n=1 Tax=Comamonas faecalis TaxID=1387849 RepID=A0ABP7S215_9BURK
MQPVFDADSSVPAAPVWEVGALCHAIADALQARFNPVTVRGEIGGFSRAASGHCYFTLKDEQGQLRCAMFRRAAQRLDFMPRDGELVQVRGQLGVYEARGDLQLIVDDLQRAGQGALFEQFLRLKAKLEGEGLFDAQRKRELPVMPRGIGLVTSPGAAALHDVVTTLARRAPHIPVVLTPALVQGAQAPQSLCQALQQLYALTQQGDGVPIDVIVLVRGGGSMEDLWAFNDEQLARTIVQSPVPLVSGVGHETDFTIADFCADLRAPTPTAAAELVAQPRTAWLQALQAQAERLQLGLQRQLDLRQQRLDLAAQRLGRPSAALAQQSLELAQLAQRLRHGLALKEQQARQQQDALAQQLQQGVQRGLLRQQQWLDHAHQRLQLLDPRLVVQRGYALLQDEKGQLLTDARQVRTGARVHAELAHGALDLIVDAPRLL